jgi:hypothetical protein
VAEGLTYGLEQATATPGEVRNRVTTEKEEEHRPEPARAPEEARPEPHREPPKPTPPKPVPPAAHKPAEAPKSPRGSTRPKQTTHK